MKKTLYCLFWLATVPLFGMDVPKIHFVTDVQKPVVAGERARFTVVADANIQDDYPFSPFETTDGIQLGLSGVSWESRNINGEETALTMWTFDLVVPSDGTFTIPETEAVIDGKTFKVPATTFTAKENPNKNLPAAPTPTTPKKPALSPIDTKFLLTGSFPTKWYVGQCFPATVQLLIGSSVRGQLTSYPQKEGDKFSASKLLSDPQKNTVHRDGHAYAAFEWPTVLTALQSGTGSLSFAVNMELERSMSMGSLFDDDDPINTLTKGLGVRSVEPRTLSTDRKTVNILPLPTPQPQNFTEAIGEFQLLPPKMLEKEFIQNEPMTLVVDVTGSGNFEAIRAPKLVCPDGQWRTYEPQTNFEAKDKLGYEGTIHFTYTLVPLKDGNVPLPTVEFCYFQPIKGQYETLKSTPETLSVKPAIRQFSPSSVTSPTDAPTKAKPKSAVKHEHAITMEPITQVATPSSLLFWIIQCLIGTILFLGTLRWRRTHTANYVTQKASKQQSNALRKSLDEAFAKKDGAAVYAAAHAWIEFVLKQKQTSVDAILQNPQSPLSDAQKTQLQTLEQTYQQSRFGCMKIDCPNSLEDILKLLEALS